MELHSKKNKVLITGVDGFTGIHLSSFLKKRGYQVFGTALNSKDPNIIPLDINNGDDIEDTLFEIRPDFIIHLAAVSFVGHSNALDFYNVNTIGTENLLKALLKIDHIPVKVLIPSSATVYGNQNEIVLHEEMIPNPNNHYGCSKLAMEKIVANYYDNIPIIVTRPFNYSGPYQSKNFLIPKVVDHFKNKKDIIQLGNVDVRREFNSIKYICEVYLRLLTCNAQSKIINVCSSLTYSITEIIETLERLTNHKISVEINPNFVRKNEIHELKGSIERLASIIDIPQPTPLEEMLKQMLCYK